MTEQAPGLVVRIRSLIPALAPAQRKVAEVVLADPAGTSGRTISDLAVLAGTSEPTVVRFCQAVGLAGYPELRLRLATETGRASASGVRDVGSDILPGDDLAQVVEKVAFADARAVEDTATQLDLAHLGEVVAAVDDARRVDVYGVGASYFVAQDLQQKLHRIGRDCYAWSDTHIMLTSAALLDDTCVAIAISHTGTTVDTVDALMQAKAGGAVTVALTNFPRSPLAQAADHVLTTAARETTYRSGATASRIAQLTVVDCLFIGVAQRSYDRTKTALAATYAAVANRHRGRR